jgi:hypothetical protein
LVTAWFLEHGTEGKAEVMGRLGRRSRQLLDDLKDKRGRRKLKKEALYCILWRTRFGRGYGPVVRHCIMNESYRFSSYLTQNTKPFHKRQQSVNAS